MKPNINAYLAYLGGMEVQKSIFNLILMDRIIEAIIYQKFLLGDWVPLSKSCLQIVDGSMYQSEMMGQDY